MSTLKCKMCGGALTYEEGKTVVECEYCGSLNTIPNIGDEKRLQLFDRANRLRSSCNFDKAFGVYEAIVAEYPEEAEAYWGLVLCKYGIEYVDDPATGSKVPTCHRSSFDSVMKDPNYDLVMECCDSVSRGVYHDQAKQIEEIRKGIVDISSKEDPYDVFICYKETDDNGNRTVDSAIAQDVYDALTAKNYKVFFSRITLEDKLGQEYEPYIFAALNSAKVMLVFGTCYDYFHAVWVKNEWSRYLKLMEGDKSKYLIPCYRNIDAYDMPEEFNKLQAQDMSKIGAIQDLVRGVEKLIPHGGNQKVIQNTGVDPQSMIKRMNLLLSEKEWQKADILAENILASDPDNASAYIGKLMAERKVSKEDDLSKCFEPLDKSRNYEQAITLADDSMKQKLISMNTEILVRIKKKRKVITFVVIAAIIVVVATVATYFFITKYIPYSQYNKAMKLYNSGNYTEAEAGFAQLKGYKDSSYYRKMSTYLSLGVDIENADKLCFLTEGDIWTFGDYYGSNEWIVLEVKGTSIHLLSQKVIDRRRFDDDDNNWENSEIRKWLNDEYYTEAFSDIEKGMIMETEGDKVTLLTVDEARTLLIDDMRLAEPTEYAVSQGLYVSKKHSYWWLRSPGYDSRRAAFVTDSGTVFEDGDSVRKSLAGVRPSIWIDLAS